MFVETYYIHCFNSDWSEAANYSLHSPGCDVLNTVQIYMLKFATQWLFQLFVPKRLQLIAVLDWFKSDLLLVNSQFQTWSSPFLFAWLQQYSKFDFAACHLPWILCLFYGVFPWHNPPQVPLSPCSQLHRWRLSQSPGHRRGVEIPGAALLGYLSVWGCLKVLDPQDQRDFFSEVGNDWECIYAFQMFYSGLNSRFCWSFQNGGSPRYHGCFNTK